jgi:hypothetical protein
MAVQVAIPGMRRINNRVADCSYAADVGVDGLTTVDIPAVATAGAGVIANAQVLAAAGNVVPAVVQTEFLMGRYGRSISVTAGAGGAGVIVGYDYLGQAIKENVTLIVGAVVSKKMFKDVAYVSVPAGGTFSIGVGVILGVPYKVLHTGITGELTSDVTAAAGALAAGVTTQSLTSADPRGTYTPAAAPDGIRTYRFTCVVDRSNLHGSAHVIV